MCIFGNQINPSRDTGHPSCAWLRSYADTGVRHSALGCRLREARSTELCNEWLVARPDGDASRSTAEACAELGCDTWAIERLELRSEP